MTNIDFGALRGFRERPLTLRYQGEWVIEEGRGRDAESISESVDFDDRLVREGGHHF